MSTVQPKDMGNLADTMRRTERPATARAILSHARNRLGDIEHVGWPALEKSLRDELQQLETIARGRGLIA